MAVSAVVAASAGPAPVAATARPPAPSSPALVIDRAATYEVAQEIGPGSINRAAKRWDVYGADLGSMFTYEDRLYMVFGDTFGGPAADPFFAVGHSNWRSNSMAFVTSSAPPSHGLYFTGMITGATETAAQLLSSQKVVGVEQTVIPTYGIAVGKTIYLYYMSVREYGAPGHWSCNYSGVAYSQDGGQHFVKYPHVVWAGDSNFGQVALVKRAPYVYVFGIPCGRYGGVAMARVPEADVLVKASYQYWDGRRWATARPRAAVVVVKAPVGELSVQWNSFYRKWLMMYLVDPTGQVVLRTANQLMGPWSRPQVVVTSAQYPELYAPYITPEWDGGRSIYFNMSVFGRYQVLLMHTALMSVPPVQTKARPLRPSA
jgi:hypothetical protein